MIVGGWGWVAAAYGLTWGALGLYAWRLATALRREAAAARHVAPGAHIADDEVASARP